MTTRNATTDDLMNLCRRIDGAIFNSKNADRAEELTDELEAAVATIRSKHDRACWENNVAGRRHEIGILRRKSA